MCKKQTNNNDNYCSFIIKNYCLLFVCYRGWKVSTKNLEFEGKNAEIGIALKDSFDVENHSGKSMSFTLSVDEYKESMKYKIMMKPDKFKLDKVKQYKQYIFYNTNYLII